MKRLFSKAGVWLFLAAVVWYVAGNFTLDNINKNNRARAKSQHQAEHHFDIGEQASVVIRTQGNEVHTGGITVIFDPNVSQASVNNENLRLSVNGKTVDGILNITLASVETHLYRSFNKFTIHLPSSVKKVAFSGVGTTELSGTLPGAELSLEIADCQSTVNMTDLKVNHLKLTSTCQMPPKKDWRTNGFVLGDGVQINRLDVSMQRGLLDFFAATIPQQIQLNIGDEVAVSGQREFLKSARFSNNF
ncbi:hypothetical protein ACO0K9_10140 [Undibacterium sp. Ji50W]|uniref:hypothetical protein n=1 Tax=Undibacterium sp. Ji50W TaxID=3413041 RepID=UPI003BF017FA